MTPRQKTLYRQGYIKFGRKTWVRPHSIAWWTMQALTGVALIAIVVVMMGMLWIVG